MQGKTAIITGGSSGIGFALAKECAADGYNIILVAHNKQRLDAAAKEIRAKFLVHVETISIDFSTPSAAHTLRSVLARKDIEILINNAGFGAYGEFTAIASAEHTAMIHTNIEALTTITQLVLPGMRKRKRGCILNVGSVASFMPGPYMAVYYASKAYVLSFSNALGEELRGSGITVTALCPGPTRTHFVERARINKKSFANKFDHEVAPVARAGYQGMHAGKRVVIQGFMNNLSVRATQLLPLGMVLTIVGRMQRARKK